MPDVVRTGPESFLLVESAPPGPAPADRLLVETPAGQRAVLGRVEVRTVRLTLECIAAEILADGRRRLERALRGSVHHCSDEGESVRELYRRGRLSDPEANEVQGIAEVQERHARLLDELVQTHAKVDGVDPAPQPPREEAPPPPSRSPRGPSPTPAHMLLYPLLPGLERLVRDLAERARQREGWEQRTITEAELAADADAMEFLRAYMVRVANEGWSLEYVRQDTRTVTDFARLLIDFETHLRKTFWVDESLAWSLLQTDLDIAGACLRLPFPASAFVFSDRGTLELCESLLSQDDDCRLRGRPIRQLTVHAADSGETPAGARLVHLGFLFDGGDGGWPYLLTRDLHVLPDHDLAAILDSHVPEIWTTTLPAIFKAPELRKLVHLTINAVLFACSWQARRRRAPGRRGDATRPEPAVPARPGEVYHLPGRIPISGLKALRDLERTETGRTIMKRFMVRGHWRRPSPEWREQHLRWIEPYWKGPDIGVVIERQYRMRS